MHIRKMVKIEKSMGLILPQGLLDKYDLKDQVVIEETQEGILLKKPSKKLSWEESFRQMKEAKEDWSEWDDCAGDGIEKLGEWKSED